MFCVDVRPPASSQLTIEADEVRARLPLLGGDVRRGLWCPREAHVRSDALTRGLAAAAAALGARIQEACEVEALVRQGDRVVGVGADGSTLPAGHVVLCTGAFDALLEPAGHALPIEPVRGQMLALDGRALGLSHVVTSESVYLVPRRNGEIWIGATEERVGFDRRVTAEGVASLLDAGIALVPALEDCTFRGAWAGLRPGTPDGLPCIGTLAPGLVVAAGHHRNGVLLAPATGQLATELVRTGRLLAAAAPFSPDRFPA